MSLKTNTNELKALITKLMFPDAQFVASERNTVLIKASLKNAKQTWIDWRSNVRSLIPGSYVEMHEGIIFINTNIKADEI